MSKILIIEDELSIADSVQTALEYNHHVVEIAQTGDEGLALALTDLFDLLLLDVNLPGISGIEICREYRKAQGCARILMLTERATVDERVEGLTSGADDYLGKPFALKELIARVDALLRRPTTYTGTSISIGPLSIDTTSRRVYVLDSEIRLKPLDYQLLEFFVRNPNRVIGQEELLARVWGNDSEATSYAVYAAVNRLRTKLGAAQDLVRTVHGVGYRLDNPSSHKTS